MNLPCFIDLLYPRIAFQFGFGFEFELFGLLFAISDSETALLMVEWLKRKKKKYNKRLILNNNLADQYDLLQTGKKF